MTKSEKEGVENLKRYIQELQGRIDDNSNECAKILEKIYGRIVDTTLKELSFKPKLVNAPLNYTEELSIKLHDLTPVECYDIFEKLNIFYIADVQLENLSDSDFFIIKNTEEYKHCEYLGITGEILNSRLLDGFERIYESENVQKYLKEKK